MSAVLALMTRSTSDPRIKMRLAERIPSATGRRELALAFIDDLIQQCSTLPEVALRLAVTPPVEGLRFARPSLPSGTFLLQRGADLGERLRNVCQDLAASGFTTVVLVGGDLPDLPVDYLRQTLDALRDQPGRVVLGPSDDGGCYLVGVSVGAGGVPDLFTSTRWRGPYAMEDVQAAVARLGLKAQVLDNWNDVDAPSDLDQLISRLRHAPATAPHTAAALKKLGF